MASEPAKKPKSPILGMAVALATTLAVASSYLAATSNVLASADSRQGFVYLTDSNTQQIEANQILVRDDNLLVQADFAEFLGDNSLAIELRMKTVAFRLGYIDEFGNGTAAYGGDFDVAREAYINDTYRSSRENRTAADAAFERAREAGLRGLGLLLGTVLLAVCALLGIFGNSLEHGRARRLLMIFVLVLLAVTVGYITYTALS